MNDNKALTAGGKHIQVSPKMYLYMQLQAVTVHNC